jgi:hypothetical protein
VKRWLITLLLALAAIPPAYAGFVYGWQLVVAGEFAMMMDDALPTPAWMRVLLTALPFTAIVSALFVVWEGVSKRRLRRALIALGVAWIASYPLYVMFLRS